MVQTFTLNEFQAYVARLPQKLQVAAKDINLEMAQQLQRKIRTRAPSGSTGSLKRIELQMKGKTIQITGPAHWSYVNAGVAPMKMIPVEFAEMHQTNPGSTAGMTTNIPNPKGWFFAGYTRGKGFVTNSLVAIEGDIPTIIERGLNKAFQK